MIIKLSSRGFTLIELLISIAILAIFSAMTLTAIVAPMREREVSEKAMEFEAGSGKFFSQFLQDVHTCSAIDTRVSGTIVLKHSTRQGEDVTYTLIEKDKEGTLRRKVGDRPSAFLLDHMKSLTAIRSPENNLLWTLRMEQNPSRFQTLDSDLVRSLTFHPTLNAAGGSDQ